MDDNFYGGSLARLYNFMFDRKHGAPSSSVHMMTVRESMADVKATSEFDDTYLIP